MLIKKKTIIGGLAEKDLRHHIFQTIINRSLMYNCKDYNSLRDTVINLIGELQDGNKTFYFHDFHQSFSLITAIVSCESFNDFLSLIPKCLYDKLYSSYEFGCCANIIDYLGVSKSDYISIAQEVFQYMKNRYKLGYKSTALSLCLSEVRRAFILSSYIDEYFVIEDNRLLAYRKLY